MTGLGFNYRDRKYGLESSVELKLNTDLEHKTETGARSRAAAPRRAVGCAATAWPGRHQQCRGLIAGAGHAVVAECALTDWSVCALLLTV